MNTSDNSNEFGVELISRIEEALDTRHWNFKLSYSKLYDIKGYLLRRIIYDSEWCRIKFQYYQRTPPESHELHISYGRLHASSEDHLMTWQGEKCYCWHGSGLLHLYFLEELSPAETLERQHGGKRLSVLEEFSKSESSKKLLQESGHMYPLIREAVIWKNYGLHLFELFDLRQPDLWAKYAAYLKEYYKLKAEYAKSKGNTPLSVNPPLYKVC